MTNTYLDEHWAPGWLRPVSSRPRLVAAAAVGVAVGTADAAKPLCHYSVLATRIQDFSCCFRQAFPTTR